MGLFSKSKNDVDVSETEQVAPGHDIKKFRLNKPRSKETISAMASETLHAGVFDHAGTLLRSPFARFPEKASIALWITLGGAAVTMYSYATS